MQATKPLTKPNKQRKMRYLAPAHLRHKLMAAHLSPELRASHGIRSFPVRTGDTVRVVRGDHKGVEGKITSVKLSKYRIFVEGLTREKVDGTTINVPIHPSKVMVTRLSLDDKWRKEILDLKKEGRKKLEKAEKAVKAEKKPKPKPEEKPVEVEEEAKEIVEEKPAVKAKVVKKKPARARKKPVRKKAAEKAGTEVKETKPKVKREPKEKTKPAAKPKRTSRKTPKEKEGGEE
jgi:large subunit ribosomal protein L24